MKKKLKTIEVTAKIGQRIIDLPELKPLPNNAIIYKARTGLGATYSEINSDRHSFIIEPNVPVIMGKVQEHNSNLENKDRQIFGVYKGVYRDDILEYLTSESKYKKILTTPEGFIDKIMPAIKENLDFYQKNFYLLIDECEKNIQDTSYRAKINAPFDIFFEFENKGLISATPLPFSDPRFAEHGFVRYVVKPDYRFSQSLELISTNNVLEAFTDYIKDNPEDRYCIFVNSTNTIEALVAKLRISDESAVFCADESVLKLELKGLHIARSDFGDRHMKKYNFFTSRYFSAFDMKLSYKPHVIMLTDVFFAKHSILDPVTEAIQIAGRLRNGIGKLAHITNYNPELKSMDKEEAILYLDGIKAMFKSILQLAGNMTHKGKTDFLEQIRKVELAKFFKPNGDYDWFMYDNFLNEERVKGYYQKPEHLLKAYGLANEHFVLSPKEACYLLGDGDRLKRETRESQRALLMEIACQLDSVEKATFYLGDKQREIELLRNLNKTLVEGYYAIGLEGLKKANYVESKIKRAIETTKQLRLLKCNKTAVLVYEYLKSNSRYTDERIKVVLGSIYNKMGVKKRPKASDIKLFYRVQRTTVGKGKGYATFNKLFEVKPKN
ncbi:hypothetical protein VRU48_08100 [Pedobacter sp. KR3-3]|uniref:Uncharacterized protein n=1 Tax=Pedobacter albus TaxID=3113905 RepID=A0ABU7I6G3_9SPHI|nr:hypothetical protein [Pedobacter sp. KR3-3]MEE1945065.1 hypothetical protein [Pedobacter sp. KR3-3]